jgi:Globin
MGAIISSRKVPQEGGKEEELVVKFPAYYIEADITTADIQRARESWELIAQGTSVEYQQKRFMLDNSSCLAWFYDSFYDHLFEVAPNTKPLFKNDIVVQGKALVRMIYSVLGILNDIPALTETLENLARGHTARGVVSSQYGIVGEVLLWTLRRVLGVQGDHTSRRRGRKEASRGSEEEENKMK